MWGLWRIWKDLRKSFHNLLTDSSDCAKLKIIARRPKDMKKKATTKKINLEQVKDLLESGLSNVQVGLIIGRHSSTVGDYRDRLGLDANRQKSETSLMVKDLHAQGMRQVDIARKLGITRQRVSKILKK
jgi:DNA-binding CsgD family transcriptional regulator